jgi:phosphoglycerate dehydrogenase-like enzyme
MKLVIYPAIDFSRLEHVCRAAGRNTVVNAADPQEAEREIAGADAFFGKLTPALLAAARQLRWVQSPTASLEHYLFPELVEHPCVLTNMRGLFSDVIADHVFGYILCFARNFHTYIRRQIEARWEPVGGEHERPSFLFGPGVECGLDRTHMHLGDATLGIIGLGAIGSEVARRGLAFGMRVVAVDPLQTAVPSEAVTLWRLDRLDDLLSSSDFVVICAPHTPRTAAMFGRAQMRRMKPAAYLINIGRGAIVSLDDLTAALNAGEIAGAGLDVYEIEPLPSGHPLWRMENVILTPHVAGYSPRIHERHLEVLLDNVQRVSRGDGLRNVVDKAQWF